MIIKFNSFINESISLSEIKMKTAIVIKIDTVENFNIIQKDLEKWGIPINNGGLSLDETNDYDYYPVILVIYIPIIDYYVDVDDPYDRMEDNVDMNDYICYNSINDFYDDINVLKYVKYKGNILPGYNPKGSNIRKV